MKVYIDESVSPKIARALRRRGLEAVDAREKENIGLTDEEQLEYVKDNRLILFTYDDDFVRIVMKRPIEHPGIIYCDQRKYTIGETIRKLAAVLEKSREKDLINQVKYL